jgi:hypothetical protein
MVSFAVVDVELCWQIAALIAYLCGGCHEQRE